MSKTDILLQVSISKNNLWTIQSKTWVNGFLSDFEIDDKEFIKVIQEESKENYSNQLVLFSVSLDIKAGYSYEGEYDVNYSMVINFEHILIDLYEKHCIELLYNQLNFIQNENELDEIIEEYDVRFEPKEFLNLQDVLLAKGNNKLIDLPFFKDLKQKFESNKFQFNFK